MWYTATMRHIPKGAGPPPPDLVRKPKKGQDRTTVEIARELVNVAQRRACTLSYVVELVTEEWRRRELAIEKAAARREALKDFVPEKVQDPKRKV